MARFFYITAAPESNRALSHCNLCPYRCPGGKDKTMKKNNATQNDATQSNTITLRELKAMLPSTRGKKLPGHAQLRQSGTPVVSCKAEGCQMEVYENGFAVYESGKRHTVLRMEHVGLAEFDSVTEDKPNYEPMDDAEWSVAVMMNGEDRLEKMRQANEEPNLMSTSDAVEDEDGETCDMEFDAGVDVEAQVIGDDSTSRMLACLTERQKEVVVMYYLKKMTMEDIAQELGISKPGVKKNLDLAEKKLRKNFTE